MNNKNRAYLKGLANKIEASMQVGKEGIKDNFLTGLNELFEARELVKIKALKNSEKTAREIADEIEKLANCEIVQTIGNVIVLYRKSNNSKIKHIEMQG